MREMEKDGGQIYPNSTASERCCGCYKLTPKYQSINIFRKLVLTEFSSRGVNQIEKHDEFSEKLFYF